MHFNNKYKISERPTILLFFNQVDRVANNVILYSKQNIKKLSEGYYKLYSIINYNTDSIVSNIKDNEKDKVDNEVMPDSNIESTNQNTKNAIFLPNTIKKINFDEVIWCFNNKNNEWNLYLNNSLKESNSIDIIEYYNPFNGELESATYGFDSNGKMIIGWGIDKDNNYYYFDDDKVTYGIMSTGWKNIENKYYFFGTNGKLLVDSITPDSYYVDEDGVCININDLKKHLNRKI